MSKRDEMEVEEVDRNDIFTDKTALTRYTSAAGIANKALTEAVKLLAPGKVIYEVTSAVDKFIQDQLVIGFGKTKLERGIAFPTCVSVNNCLGHFSPYDTDKTALKEGDLVKIDLGVHIDGYIAVVAHTLEVNSQGNAAPAITGRKADVICAAHYAAEAAHRLIRAGGKNTEVTEAIAKIAEAFHVKPVEAVLSHQLKRFVIDGNNVIANKYLLDQKVDEFTFEAGQVYGVDIVMSTGEGKGREIDVRPTVYKRAVDQTYSLKLASSRTLLNEISKKSPTLPFTLASMGDQRTSKMGITELNTHGMVVPYPVLFEKNGEFVAQIKFVAAILKKGTNRLTGHPLPLVTSEYKITDQSILDLLAQTTGKDKKKTDAPATDAAPMDTN